GEAPVRRRLIAIVLLMLLIGVVVAVLRSGLPTARAALDARRQIANLEAMQLSRSQLPSVQQLTLLDQRLTQLDGDLATIRDNWGFWQGPVLLGSRVDSPLHH